jgi:hypothetical protein
MTCHTSLKILADPGTGHSGLTHLRGDRAAVRSHLGARQRGGAAARLRALSRALLHRNPLASPGTASIQPRRLLTTASVRTRGRSRDHRLHQSTPAQAVFTRDTTQQAAVQRRSDPATVEQQRHIGTRAFDTLAALVPQQRVEHAGASRREGVVVPAVLKRTSSLSESSNGPAANSRRTRADAASCGSSVRIDSGPCTTI